MTSKRKFRRLQSSHLPPLLLKVGFFFPAWSVISKRSFVNIQYIYCLLSTQNYSLKLRRSLATSLWKLSFERQSPLKRKAFHAPAHYQWASSIIRAIGMIAILWTVRKFFLSLSDPQDVTRTLYYTRIMSLVTLKMNTTLEELYSELKLTWNLVQASETKL